MENRDRLINSFRELAPSEHIGLFYKSRGDQTKVLIPFIQSTLEKKQNPLVLTASDSYTWLKVALESNGINSSQVQILNNLKLEEIPAIINSFPHGRIILDLLGKTVTKYPFYLLKSTEVAIDQLVKKKKHIALCMYDQNLLKPVEVENLIYMHSSLVLKETFCENPYYSPTSEEDRVSMMLDRLFEYKSYTEVLSERSYRYKKLFQSNMIAVMFLSGDGTISECNDTFLNMAGFTKQQVDAGAINWKSIVPLEEHIVMHRAIMEMQTNESCKPFELSIKHHNGSEITMLLGGSSISSDNNEFIIFALDLTEQKVLEKRRDDFLRTASHELKTPLTTLKAFSDLLTKHSNELKGNKKLKTYLEKMDKQITRLTGLVRDLLDVSKMQSGTLDYSDELFSIDTLVNEVVENTQLTTWKHKIILKGETDELLFADPFRISQALTNVLNNAIKYSPKSGNIIVSMTANKNNVTIGIKDYGIGIPKDKQSLLFKKFNRLDDKKRESYPGLGIGLYIVSEILSRYSGKIWFFSEEGKGSTFYLSLPIKM